MMKQIDGLIYTSTSRSAVKSAQSERRLGPLVTSEHPQFRRAENISARSL